MKKTIYFLLISFLILIAFSLFFWLYEVKFFIGQASVNQVSFSLDNSYVFITPLRAMANGQEKIRITVFILNNQGLGIGGRNVVVAHNKALNIDTVQRITDNYGKAYFDVSSSQPGEYFLEITVDNISLKQQAHLSFY